MGADNQAERVIARMGFREELARLFYLEFCKAKGTGIPWEELAEWHRQAMIAGIHAVLNEIDRRIR